MFIKHPETDAVTEVADQSYELVWQHRGWEPTDPPLVDGLPVLGPVSGTDAAAAIAAEARAGFDPAAHTGKQVLAYLADAPALERRRVLRAEAGIDVDGGPLPGAQHRSTVLDHAEQLGVPAGDLVADTPTTDARADRPTNPKE